jgi:hypothetical protein
MNLNELLTILIEPLLLLFESRMIFVDIILILF